MATEPQPSRGDGASAAPDRPARSADAPQPLRPLLLCVVLLVLVMAGVAGLRGFQDLSAARARERELETRIQAARQRVVALQARVERLDHDDATLEREARKLGLVRAGDIVIRLPPAKTP